MSTDRYVKAPSVSALRPELEATLTSWTARHPDSSVLVSRLEDAGPVPVLRFQADVPRAAGSTVKLVTAAGALIVLGAGFRDPVLSLLVYGKFSAAAARSGLRSRVRALSASTSASAAPRSPRKYSHGPLFAAVRLHQRWVSARTRLRSGQGRSAAARRAGLTPSLETLARRMNVTSDNLVAEGLATDVGAVATGRASHKAGIAYVAALFKDRGILAAEDRLVDASGLSAANRLSAASLVRLLAAARVEPAWGDALVRSLPRGGEGTLRRRFLEHGRANTVRAKTGHLPARTAALAGLVTSVGGSTYAFAILMEGPDVSEARAVQDDLVRLLAQGAADADDRRQG